MKGVINNVINSFSSTSSSDDETFIPTESSRLLESVCVDVSDVSVHQANVLALDLEDFSGLSSATAARLLEEDGYNELPSTRVSPIISLLKHLFLDLVSIIVWVGIIITAVAMDWIDFGVLLGLQLLNAALMFHESRKADKALTELADQLALKAHVLRDGNFVELAARELVVGDVFKVELGCIVPADAVAGGTVRLNTSALTGESLPKTINRGDEMFSGSFCTAGECLAKARATGLDTMLGRQAKLINQAKFRGPFATLLRRISFSLLIGACALVVAIIVMQVVRGARTLEQLLDLASFVVALLVSSIPVGMQAVCTTTMAVGANRLAKKSGVIVQKLPVLLDLSSMTTLCADKTGTLTKNELTLCEPWLNEGVSKEELMLFATLACDYHNDHQDAIDSTIIAANTVDLASWVQDSFTPFDPSIKRTEAVVRNIHTNLSLNIYKGSPQIILQLADFEMQVKENVLQTVEDLALRGLRSIGVCKIDKVTGKGIFLGLLSMHDPPRDDTIATISALNSLGVRVKMISGDHTAICRETCKIMGLNAEVVDPSYFDNVALKTKDEVYNEISGISGFGEVIPEQKHFVVSSLQRKEVVGMTGDGVNDAAALKVSDVGIAVCGASDAARGASDLVFTKPGISGIVTSIVIARKIFERLRNYILYRISISISILFCSFLLLAIHGFALPPLAIIVLVIVADVTVLASSRDKVFPSTSPSQWNMKALITLSCVIGLLSALEGCVVYWIGRRGGLFFSAVLSDEELAALVFLSLSLGSSLLVFVARTSSLFFTRRPGWSLLVTIGLGLITTVSIAVWAEFEGFKGLLWQDCGCVVLLALISFLVKDVMKVLILQSFKSMEKTNKSNAALFEQNRALLEEY